MTEIQAWFEQFQVKGDRHFSHGMAGYTTLRVGGQADLYWHPLDFDDIVTVMQRMPASLALTALGEGSNMLIRDGGIRGLVMHIAKGLDTVEVNGNRITAQSGASCGKVARIAREAGLDGMAFWCGIPGSVGGAVFMNAGAYGRETVDTLVHVDIITREGVRQRLTPQELSFAYRQSGLPQGAVVEAACFEFVAGDKDHIKAQMRTINRERAASQPLEWPSSGSWFTNPKGTSAWKVVDAAGCRGLRLGDAQVSEKHSNFLINRGAATAASLEALSAEVQSKVLAQSGVQLQTEVRMVGTPTKKELAA